MNAGKRIRRVYYLLLAFFWFATGLPMALSFLLAQARGLDLFEVGLALGIYSLAVVVLEVPTGGLADAVGRKRVAALAYGVALAASVLFLFAFSLPALLLAFVLNGVGRALSSGALDAWFVDALRSAEPEADLQPVLGRAGTVSLLALAVGSLLGSALPRILDGLPPEGTAVLTPLSAPLLAAQGAWLALLLLTLRLVVEDRPAAAGRGLQAWRDGVRQVPAIVRQGVTLTRHNPVLVRLLAAALASGLVLISLEALWQPHFAGLLGGSQGKSPLFGLLLGGSFVAGMAGNMLAGPLSRRLRRRYGLVAALFQGWRGLALMGLALQTGPLPAALLFWAVYLGMGVVNSPHATLLNGEIPSEQRSAMLSIESFVAYLGSIAGSVGLSYLAEKTSVSVAWLAGGAVLVVSLGLYLSVDARLRSRQKEESHAGREALFHANQTPDAG